MIFLEIKKAAELYKGYHCNTLRHKSLILDPLMDIDKLIRLKIMLL